MSRASRICTLLLVFLLVLLSPLCIYAGEDDDHSGDDGEDIMPSKLYSYSFEEGDTQASLHLHRVYAERGNVDLLDAFVETAEHGVSLYISLGDFKLYLTAGLVSQIAKRGEPVTIYVKEIVEETNGSDTDETVDSGEETPVDVVYDVDLGFEFDREALKIQIKHKTKHADRLRVLSIDENGSETELTSSYGSSLVAFFPEQSAFTLRITEDPPPEGASRLPVLLSGILLVLVALSVVLIVLLRRGTLESMYLRRYGK